MNQFTEELKDLLKQDIIDLTSLKSLLEQEKITLTTRNTQKISQLAEHKSKTVAQLESRAKLKAKLMSNSGLGIRPGQVEEKLATLNDPELMSLWQTSRDQLNECQQQNTVNGSIISQSRQRVTKLMTIIRGQNKAPNLYGQQGKAQTFNSSHRIGKA
ncbi:MAG: flagellar biosynthesis/type III secretory pathway chaperone [Oleiphilaceae bacterium]|jgi:flagellar biosynthesis/type III secretory pathway chaperone